MDGARIMPHCPLLPTYDVGMSTRLPGVEEIDRLHRRLAPSAAAYELVHTHCVIVAELSRQILQSYIRAHGDAAADDGSAIEVDEHLMVVGALVHDIGTYRVFADAGADGGEGDAKQGSGLRFDSKRYILHGMIGYRLLLDEGYGRDIAAFARNHTGVGITRRQVVEQHLPLPPDDYVPRTPEQEIVMYADKFNSKSQPPAFVSAETQEKRCARFGADNLERWRALVRRYGVPDLPPMARRYAMRIK